MHRWRVGLMTLAVLAVLGAGIAPLLRRGARTPAPTDEPAEVPSVQSALITERSLHRTVRVTGALKSAGEAAVAARVAGRVLAVRVTSGQQVRAGETTVVLDDADYRRQLAQAQLAERGARTVWQKAQEGLHLTRQEVDHRIEDARDGVEQARLAVDRAEAGQRVENGTAAAEVARAQAGVDAAKSTLAQVRRGARPEQIRQATIQLEAARRGAQLARKTLDDLEYLYSKGGIPRVRLDEARQAHSTAADGVLQAQATLDLLNAGAGREEIAAAEAQVRQAEAALRAAEAGADRGSIQKTDLAAAQGALVRAHAGVRRAMEGQGEIAIAEANVRAAALQLQQASIATTQARTQVSECRITCPLPGIVRSVSIHVGELAQPGIPLVMIAGTAGVFLDAAIPARLLARLRPGQAAVITIDALPGARINGRVRSVGQAAGPDGRSFPVALDILGNPAALKPGAAGRAEIRVESYEGALTVPVSAVRSEAGAASVWVIRDGKIEEAPVEVPYQDEQWAVIRGYVRRHEPVVLTLLPGLRPGDRVRHQVAVQP